ncbi:MAG: hypothetical protein RMK97_07995, partial [Sutterellaceae bacterium]|nr:hypothetical protein [Burkholderiaceae bacterium]MDW8430425.1 hypothetical protein [Sutterellaceae bacterium]
EGGVVPSLRASGRAFRYTDGGAEVPVDFRAEDFGFSQGVLPPQRAASDDGSTFDPDAALAATCEQGLAALRGKAGAMRDNLIVGAATILWHLGLQPSLRAAADAAVAALEDGRAAAHFDH